MKLIYAAAALLALTSLSCKKSDDNNGNNGGGGGGTTERTWKVGSNSYTVNNYSRSSETYSAYDKDGNSISFVFDTYPPAAGTYRVVNDNASLGAGQVKVYTGSFASNMNTYDATGHDGVSATVSFESNKIKIVLPETWALRDNSTSFDSLKISATLSPL